MTKEKPTKHNDCLVAFDVEGVLIPKNRYLVFEISQKLGFFGFLKILILGFLYETSLLSLESALKQIFSLLKGFSAEEILEIHKKIPLIPETEKVFEDLKKREYKIALISSGLPTQVVQDLAKKLNADYAVGLILEISDGKLTGAIEGEVIKQQGKYHVLKSILEKEKLTAEDCIVVADDRNNSSMFPLCKLRIGYNPDFVLTVKSDFVTRGALTEILPPITGEKTEKPQSNLSNRGLRETIHTGSFLLTFISVYLTGNILLGSIILLLAAVYTISELARIRGINIPVLSAITWNAANKNELYEFAAAPIYFALGISFSLLFLPVPIGYVAITVLILGDGGAHILGIKYGKTPLPFNKGKNVEGTIFGFLFAFLGAMLFVSPLVALIAAGVGMLVEGIPSPINDNFTIPFVVGLLLILIM